MGKYDNKSQESYIGAPYNFIPFSEKHMPYGTVYQEEKMVPAHNSCDKELLSGEIHYTITAKTPVFIGSGVKDQNNIEQFCTDERGHKIIPGSSFRGLIRSNVQILGLSSFADDIDGDYSLMYRNVAGRKGAQKDAYGKLLKSATVSIKTGKGETAQFSVLKNVAAGYLKHSEDGAYILYGVQMDPLYSESEMNYYILSERTVVNDYLNSHDCNDALMEGKEFHYPLFMKKNGKSRMIHVLNKPFRKYIRSKDAGNRSKKTIPAGGKQCWVIEAANGLQKGWEFCLKGRKGAKEGFYLPDPKNKNQFDLYVKEGRDYTQKISRGTISYEGTKNGHYEERGRKQVFVSDYKPYRLECLYKVADKRVTAVRNNKNISEEEREQLFSEGYQIGYAVSTGPMNNKKAVYIIPEVDLNQETKRFSGDNDPDIRAYEIDFNRKKTTLENFGGELHYRLPERGEMFPVFYIHEKTSDRWYFGYTPRLRLMYNKQISDGIPEKFKNADLDYCKALFGYSNNEDGSYKSRVSFSNAAIITKQSDNMDTANVVLSEPKPTSYMDYIKKVQNSDGTYNTDFELRGMKQYWLRNDCDWNEFPPGKKNADFVSHFKPVRKDTTFSGTVRFEKLKKEELGLLLWSMYMDGKSQFNIGKGKPYGFGCIEIGIESINILEPEKAYSLNSFHLDPFVHHEADVKEFMEEHISYYKKVISEALARVGYGSKHNSNLDLIMEMEHVQDFFRMKDSTSLPDPKMIRYMDINNKEYKNRQKALPTIKEIVPKKKNKAGELYQAEVLRVEGKTVKCKTLDGQYIKFTHEDILCQEVTKKELKNIMTKGKLIQVRCEGKNNSVSHWVCINF